MQKRDAQPSAGVAKRVITEGRSVIDEKLTRQPAARQGFDQAILEALQPLREVSASKDYQARVVVDDAEDIGLP